MQYKETDVSRTEPGAPDAPQSAPFPALADSTSDTINRRKYYPHKHVWVGRQSGTGRTTISMPKSLYAKMLFFANNNPKTVTKACRAASMELRAVKGTFWSQSVRQLALKKLQGAYIPARKN